jgi:hypothetical protein
VLELAVLTVLRLRLHAKQKETTTV